MKFDKDQRSDKRFAVLFGGKGHEHEISCKTAGRIIKASRRLGFEVLPIGISRAGDVFICFSEDSAISDGSCFLDEEKLISTFPVRLCGRSGFLADGEIISVDSALIAMHGDKGEDGVVQGLLDSAGIPYTGARTVSGAIAYDKAAAKALAEKIGIPTVPWVLLTERDPGIARERAGAIGYPMFIKPSGLGSSVGAARVDSGDAFEDAYLRAYELSCGRVLAERYIENKCELECAYICAFGVSAVTPPGMIKAAGGFYDYDAKYKSNTAKIYAVANVKKEISDLARSYTERLCAAFSLRHIARVDYFLTDGGELLFNEINTFPGMTEGSLYSAMLSSFGIDEDKEITALLKAPLWESERGRYF